jgi:hypothetical protein
MIGHTIPMQVAARRRRSLHVLSIFTIGASLTAACSRSSCENKAFYGLPSPDGRYIAFIFHRTCAAPDGVSTQVSLMPFHESLRGDPGNVLAVAGEQPVKVSWHGPTTLWVAGFQDASFRRAEPLDGIRIEFH